MPKILNFNQEDTTEQQEKKENPFQRLADNWPSPYVSRADIEKFSGGLIKRLTLRKLDSLGEGPRGRVVLGKIVGYPVQELIEWMQERMSFYDDPSSERVKFRRRSRNE